MHDHVITPLFLGTCFCPTEGYLTGLATIEIGRPLGSAALGEPSPLKLDKMGVKLQQDRSEDR